ncbi:MAG: 1-deoxy-D-xylulose-5-phosphate reductoisomerase, partial [Verrucomicrobiales bacterium]
FPALRLAREAGERGGTLPAVLNAANEVAVQAFRDRKLSFPGIWKTVEATMTAHSNVSDPSLEHIIEADTWARSEASTLL